METLACGTGAYVSVVAAKILGKVDVNSAKILFVITNNPAGAVISLKELRELVDSPLKIK